MPHIGIAYRHGIIFIHIGDAIGGTYITCKAFALSF
jgi:hypothetical protein